MMDLVSSVETAMAYSYRDDPHVPPFADDRPIILFDGHCKLCSGWVQFVLKHDRVGRFRLLAAQSRLGEALLIHYGLSTTDYESNLLISEGRAYLKSDATTRMAIGLGFPWSMAGALRLLPRRWTDTWYDLIARNRYRLFGRSNTCYAPTPEVMKRFLE